MVTTYNSKDMVFFANYSKEQIEGKVRPDHLRQWKMGQDLKDKPPVIQVHYAFIIDPGYVYVGNQEYKVHRKSPLKSSELDTGKRVVGYFLPFHEEMHFVVTGALEPGTQVENASLHGQYIDESVKGWVMTSWGISYFRSKERNDYEDMENSPSQWRGQVLLGMNVRLENGGKWVDYDFWYQRSDIHNTPDLLIQSQEDNIIFQQEVVDSM